MTTEYRQSLAVGGTDARMMVQDYDKWAFERQLKLSGNMPTWMEKEPTDAMVFGTQVHMALLEPEKYEQNGLMIPHELNMATTRGKELKSRFEEYKIVNPDAFLIKEKDVWAIKQIKKNWDAENFPQRWTMFQYEKEVFRTYRGHQLKGMIDVLTHDSVVDVKTTRDINRCEQSIIDYAYHIQLVHYAEIVRQTSYLRENNSIIFIENIPPFRIKEVKVEQHTMAAAYTAWEYAMNRAIKDGLMIKAEQ